MLNILILSQDATLFQTGADTFGDTRKRHAHYADLLRARHPRSEVRVITYTPARMAKEYEAIGDGLKLYGTRSRHRALFALDLFRCLRRALADGWRPDLITAQTPWEEGFLGLWISRFLGCRFMPQLHFDLFSLAWRREERVNSLRYWISCWVIRRSHAVRAVCGVLREKVSGRLGVSRERIHVVPVGVNFPVLPVPSAPRAQVKTVLFVGRFCSQKNIPAWIEVADRVRRRLGPVRFVMAGHGAELEATRAEVARRGLSVDFEFLGSVGHERLPGVYAASDLLLLTSHYEGFGRVLVEGYLAGVPAVSTACTGPEDIIEDGVTGYLTDLGDVDALAARVEELLRDDVRRLEFAARGQRHVSERYTLDSLSEDLLNCWEKAYA